MPLVSIGMPVYNCASTLSDAMASIVNQTFQDWELIIIDDGSTDGTLEVAKSFHDERIRVIHDGRNKRLPTRLNQAASLASGKLFARMDGDDVSYPDRLSLQVEYLNKHPDVDLLGGSVLIFGDSGRASGVRRACETHEEIIGRPWRVSVLPHVTWLGRREWFLKHPYNERMTRAQDRELLTRCRTSSRYAALSEVLVAVREAEITSAKQISARRVIFETFLREGARQHSASLLLISAPLELLKLGVDLVAIKSGRPHKILKHRVPQLRADDEEKWIQVLEQTRATAARNHTAHAQ